MYMYQTIHPIISIWLHTRKVNYTSLLVIVKFHFFFFFFLLLWLLCYIGGQNALGTQINVSGAYLPANHETLEIGTNGREISKNLDMPEFPIHY